MLDGLIEIIGAIGGAYLLMKTTIEIQSLKTNNRQSDYDFTKRLLEDIKVFKREQGSLLCEDKDRRLFLVASAFCGGLQEVYHAYQYSSGRIHHP